MHNYQISDGHSTEQKIISGVKHLLKCLSISYSSDLKHKVEITRFNIIQEVKLVLSQNH